MADEIEKLTQQVRELAARLSQIDGTSHLPPTPDRRFLLVLPRVTDREPPKPAGEKVAAVAVPYPDRLDSRDVTVHPDEAKHFPFHFLFISSSRTWAMAPYAAACSQVAHLHDDTRRRAEQDLANAQALVQAFSNARPGQFRVGVASLQPDMAGYRDTADRNVKRAKQPGLLTAAPLVPKAEAEHVKNVNAMTRLLEPALTLVEALASNAVGATDLLDDDEAGVRTTAMCLFAVRQCIVRSLVLADKAYTEATIRQHREAKTYPKDVLDDMASKQAQRYTRSPNDAARSRAEAELLDLRTELALRTAASATIFNLSATGHSAGAAAEK